MRYKINVRLRDDLAVPLDFPHWRTRTVDLTKDRTGGAAIKDRLDAIARDICTVGWIETDEHGIVWAFPASSISHFQIVPLKDKEERK